jgi:hypothetical protein
MAAAALRDIRNVDSSKLSISHTQPNVSAPQLQYHMQTPQVQQQQSQFMQNISDAPGPLLQLASSRPQSPLDVGVNMPQVYSEADIHMPSRSVSGTVALHSMLGRTHIGCSISPSESGPLNNVMRPNQSSQQSQSGSILQGGSVVAREPQVSSQPWFQPIRDQVQPDVVSRIGHLETSPTSRVSSSFSLPQQSEQSLTGIPLPSSSFIYRDNGQEQDSVQSDRHFLFGVSIDQPLGANPATNLHTHAFAKNKDTQSRYTGNPMLQGQYCPPATPDLPAMNAVGLDESGMFQRNPSWPGMPPAPQRTFIKVHKLGNFSRSIEIPKLQSYAELRAELARLFNLEALLEDPERTAWQLVFVDNENDTLLVGDDPWEEFVSCVRSIKILSPTEIQQMSQEQLEILNSVPVPPRPSSSNSEDARTQNSPVNPPTGSQER